jgi:signal transduction histidine kinase
MMPSWRQLRRPRPIVVAIVATLFAAGLVLYYQYQALTALQSQSRALLQQISEQTAADIAVKVRQTLDGPVLDTLLAVTHPDLRQGRLDLVSDHFRRGLREYPQVQRFFVWTKETEAVASGEALFLGRHSVDELERIKVTTGVRLSRDPVLGRAITDLANRSTHAQYIYVSGEVSPGQEVFLRLYWTDASRLSYYAIVGFLVSPSTLPDMFAALHERSLAALLQERGGDAPLELRVTDERGVVVYGRANSEPAAASVNVSMEFYPSARVESRLVAGVTPKNWRFEVSAPMRNGGLVRGYLPTVASVLLMLVAFGLTVEARRRSDDLARKQADFIAHASHQLKTPLSLLSAATETVEMAHVTSPEKLSQYLGIMRNEVTRLSVLVQRMLEFSRLQKTRNYEFEELDLGALVRETVEAFERSLSSQQFVFRVEQRGVSPTVMADPAALEQVLANLLDNAVKYSADARDVLVVVRSSGGDASIDVIDRGPGISRADRHRIFDKFYRGAAASRDRKGFGLGLPIVQELVQAHRGRVEVVSTIGAGSTFSIILPTIAPSRTEPTRGSSHSTADATEAAV